MLDPRTHAVRPDLADVRLAGQVFAPHYAAPLPCRISRPIALMIDPSGSGEQLAALEAGEPFEVLEIADTVAWGIAPACGLVGYVERAALGNAEDVTP